MVECWWPDTPAESWWFWHVNPVSSSNSISSTITWHCSVEQLEPSVGGSVSRCSSDAHWTASWPARARKRGRTLSRLPQTRHRSQTQSVQQRSESSCIWSSVAHHTCPLSSSEDVWFDRRRRSSAVYSRIWSAQVLHDVAVCYRYTYLVTRHLHISCSGHLEEPEHGLWGKKVFTSNLMLLWNLLMISDIHLTFCWSFV